MLKRGPITRGYLPGRYGQLHFRSAGEQSALPTLVLLHQNPSSSLEYERLIVEMARDRHVIAFDTPGYGMSDGPDAPLSMADYAACFVEALAMIDLAASEACDVYGFHTGALLAIETALAMPTSIGRLVLTGIPMRSVEERAALLESARATPRLDEAGEAALGMAKALWDFIVVKRTEGVSLDRAAQIWVDKLTPLDRAPWAYHGVWSYPFEVRLPLVRQSTLLLQPAESIQAQSIAAAALMPNATVVELPGPGRDLFELPDSVAFIGRSLRQFLDVAPSIRSQAVS